MTNNPMVGNTGDDQKSNGSLSGNQDLATTGKDVGSKLGAATATATGLAQEYGQKISEAAGQAKDFVGEKVGVVSDKIKELKEMDISALSENAKEYARQKPGQAILIAAGAGLLLGLILRGRR